MGASIEINQTQGGKAYWFKEFQIELIPKHQNKLIIKKYDHSPTPEFILFYHSALPPELMIIIIHLQYMITDYYIRMIYLIVITMYL